MAVAQLVSLYESLGQEGNPSTKSFSTNSFRTQSSSRSRISLNTFLSHNFKSRSSLTASPTMATSTASSSRSSSPSSSFSSFQGKHRAAPMRDVAGMINHAGVPHPHNAIRRQLSAIDMALEEEQMAGHAELVGLGLLGPRPRANTGSSSSSSQYSVMEFIGEGVQAPTVFEGIFEVMERA